MELLTLPESLSIAFRPHQTEDEAYVIKLNWIISSNVAVFRSLARGAEERQGGEIIMPVRLSLPAKPLNPVMKWLIGLGLGLLVVVLALTSWSLWRGQNPLDVLTHDRRRNLHGQLVVTGGSGPKMIDLVAAGRSLRLGRGGQDLQEFDGLAVLICERGAVTISVQSGAAFHRPRGSKQEHLIGVPVALQNGDHLILGPYDLRFQTEVTDYAGS
jgi:hypothetical protein